MPNLYSTDVAWTPVWDWVITPAPPPAWVTRTLTAPSAPGQPSAGTFPSPISWSTTWTDSTTLGYPVAKFWVRCVASGAACSATIVSQDGPKNAGVQSGTVSGLTVGAQYSCYTVAKSAFAEVCSPATAVTMPGAGAYGAPYTISHQDGRAWKRAGASPWSGNYMNLDTGTALSLYATPSGSGSGYRDLFDTNQGVTFDWPGNGYPGTLSSGGLGAPISHGITLYSNPGGGYAIVTVGGATIG